jgi:hypothetical protein
MNEMSVSPRVKAVKAYYRRLDAGEFAFISPPREPDSN